MCECVALNYFFFLFYTVQILMLGNDAAYSGMNLPTSVNLIKTNTIQHCQHLMHYGTKDRAALTGHMGYTATVRQYTHAVHKFSIFYSEGRIKNSQSF